MRLEYVKDWSIGRTKGKFHCLQVEMEYLTNLSKNSYKTRDGFIKYNVQQWMAQLAFIIKATLNTENVTLQPPLRVTIDGEFNGTGRMPDIQNFIDVVCDAIQEGTGINDKDYQVVTGLPKRDSEAKLIIGIEAL